VTPNDSTAAGLPEAFVSRLRRILPEAFYDAVLRTFTLSKAVSFRVNTLKCDAPTLQRELESKGFALTPVGWYSGAFLIPAEQKTALTETEAFYEGRLYIQNLASMVAPMLLSPEPGETVLDLAAAPGGKTLQLAGMMQNRGWLSAVEPVKERFFRLKRNLEHQGVEIAHTYMTDGRSVGKKCPAMFDRVLLDAPCSSESRFKSFDAKSTAFWSERKVKETSKVQKRLLLSALDALKPGGEMLYCTCAFSPEENELIVEGVLKKLGDALEILPVELPFDNVQEGLGEWEGRAIDPRLKMSCRILPTESMDGFYLCKLRKRSGREG